MAQVHEGVQIPEFHGTKHATIITHREYVQDIVVPTTDTAFTNVTFSLNPGLSATFPWLAGVAANYDQYQILGMIWEFRTLSSDITAGGALGSVILATDYDTADLVYANKLEMENSEYCTSNKPSVDTVHCIECDPSLSFSPIKYIRSGAVPSGKDVRLYDHGLFQIATQGLPGVAGTVIGELWCSYEIALYKPNLQNSLDMLFDKFSFPTTISASHYMGPDTTTVSVGTNGSSLGGSAKNSTYTFPSTVALGSIFLINYSAQGAATTITTGMQSTLVGLTGKNLFAVNSVNNVVAPTSAALGCVSTTIIQTVTVTAQPCTFQISGGTLPGTSTGADLWVFQINNAS